MKDPYSRAFVIKIWRWELFEIWHRDRHGSDGACGWTFPHLTDYQRKQLKIIAWDEGLHPYYLRCPGKVFNGSRTEAEHLYRSLILNVARMLRLKVSLSEATLMAIQKVHSAEPFDGARIFCWQPGWHNNSGKDTPNAREEHFLGIVHSIARELLADKRSWWRHPKWHVHHWSLGGAPVRWFKRMFVLRCKYCRRRFKRIEAPCSDYSGTQYWHSECEGKRAATVGLEPDKPWPRS